MSIAIVASLFLHYAVTLAIFGAAAFRLLMTPDQTRAIDRQLQRLAGILVAVALVSAVAVLMVASSSMSGAWSGAVDPKVIDEVLLTTSFGKIWSIHLILVVVLGFISAVRVPLARPWLAIVTFLILGTFGFVGHAAMVEGVAGDLRRLNQVVHLMAAGAWLGGLIPLGLALMTHRTAPERAVPLLHRFSAYGTIAVVLVLATGVINSVALVGTFGALVSPDYGWTLLVKIALVAVMLALAAFNRLRLLPRLTHEVAYARRLRQSIVLELVLGIAVVLAASLLGTLAPPIHP